MLWNWMIVCLLFMVCSSIHMSFLFVFLVHQNLNLASYSSQVLPFSEGHCHILFLDVPNQESKNQFVLVYQYIDPVLVATTCDKKIVQQVCSVPVWHWDKAVAWFLFKLDYLTLARRNGLYSLFPEELGIACCFTTQ